MRTAFQPMLQEARRRHLRPEEVRSLRASAAAMRSGTDVARLSKRHAQEIALAVQEKLFVKYPQKLQIHELCREKATRDMVLTMRYAAYDVALDDPDYSADRMFTWFRTILNAFEFGHDLVGDAYLWVQEEARRRMPPEEAERLCRQVELARQIFISPDQPPPTARNARTG